MLSPSGCQSLGEGSATHVFSSPLIPILCIHWCDIQGDEVLRDGVYPSLPLPSLTLTSVHVCFEDVLDAVATILPLDMSVPVHTVCVI